MRRAIFTCDNCKVDAYESEKGLPEGWFVFSVRIRGQGIDRLDRDQHACSTRCLGEAIHTSVNPIVYSPIEVWECSHHPQFVATTLYPPCCSVAEKKRLP